jgi:hypothetical protein
VRHLLVSVLQRGQRRPAGLRLATDQRHARVRDRSRTQESCLRPGKNQQLVPASGTCQRRDQKRERVPLCQLPALAPASIATRFRMPFVRDNVLQLRIGSSRAVRLQQQPSFPHVRVLATDQFDRREVNSRESSRRGTGLWPNPRLLTADREQDHPEYAHRMSDLPRVHQATVHRPATRRVPGTPIIRAIGLLITGGNGLLQPQSPAGSSIAGQTLSTTGTAMVGTCTTTITLCM